MRRLRPPPPPFFPVVHGTGGRKYYLLYFPVALLLLMQLLDGIKYQNILFTDDDDLSVSHESGIQVADDVSATEDYFFTKPFCQPWSASDALNRTLQPFDEWHTHHPNWIVVNETDEQFCVEPRDTQTQPIILNMMKFYANQFHSPCNVLNKRPNWGSGWSATFWNAQNGLILGLNNHVPYYMDRAGDALWIYAANMRDGSNVTCPAADFTCYFLPYHGCGSKWNISAHGGKLIIGPELTILSDKDEFAPNSGISNELGWSAYLFHTRKQLWLRRAVFDCKEQFYRAKAIDEGSDCTAIHVRRGDVIYEEDPLPYFPVADYVNMIPKGKLNDPNHYILLLTDDSNAIDEAHEFYPELKWAYVDRPRYNSSNPEWQEHTPSGNPAFDVTVLLAEIEIAMKCSTLVRGISGFSDIIFQHMKSANSNATSYDIHNGNSTILGMPKLDGDNNILVASNLATVLMEMRMNKSENKLI